jgi:hypothetical protein
MPNKRISDLSYIPESEISGNTLVPLVTYFSAATGDTVHTYVDDLQNYIINNGYWTSGSTGTGSVTINNGGGSDSQGNYTYSEGQSSFAVGDASHAEGQGTTSTGFASHSEGRNTTADGNYSHAEGNGTQSLGNNSHSEGSLTTSNGDSSHAQGEYTNSVGLASHASGLGLNGNEIIANGQTSFIHCEVTGLLSSGVYSDNASILGGIDNFISGASNNSSIIGGKENYIGTGSTSSTILGGDGNMIGNGVTNSVILGGVSISATSGNTVYVPSFVIYTEYEPTSFSDPAGEPGSITWSSNTDKLYYKTANGWFVIGGTPA